MRNAPLLLAAFLVTPVLPSLAQDVDSLVDIEAQLVQFDGADYSTKEEQIAHGQRLSGVLGCNDCHLEDYTGADFGAMIPTLEGLWATNITRTMPEMSDADLERLLREGVHPDREIYLMPSKQSQFLVASDMDALIAYLRTIEPAGEATPIPPEGFENAVAARLPDDYWAFTDADAPRKYRNAAEEADYFAANTIPDLGEDLARGRMLAQVTCTICHGAAMDGVGEPAGDIQATLDYSVPEFEQLLREGIVRDGVAIENEWGTGHAPPELTDSEIASVFEYTRALARHRD